MLVPFRSFAFLKMFCLSLNRKSLQTIVLGLLLLFLPALCARSISTFSMSSRSFNIEWTLLSHSSQLSLLCSFIPSIFMLFPLEIVSPQKGVLFSLKAWNMPVLSWTWFYLITYQLYHLLSPWFEWINLSLLYLNPGGARKVNDKQQVQIVTYIQNKGQSKNKSMSPRIHAFSCTAMIAKHPKQTFILTCSQLTLIYFPYFCIVLINRSVIKKSILH